MKQETIKNYLFFLFFIFMIIKLEVITNLPYFNEILFVLILLSILTILRNIHTENKKIESGDDIRIRSQLDNFYKILFIVLGFASLTLTTGYYFDENFILIELINHAMFGIIMLINGFYYKDSIILSNSFDSEVITTNVDFKIHPDDEKVEFSKFQIVVIKSDGNLNRIKNLELNAKEAGSVKLWLKSKLKNSSLTYSWNSGNNIKEI